MTASRVVPVGDITQIMSSLENQNAGAPRGEPPRAASMASGFDQQNRITRAGALTNVKQTVTVGEVGGERVARVVETHRFLGFIPTHRDEKVVRINANGEVAAEEFSRTTHRGRVVEQSGGRDGQMLNSALEIAQQNTMGREPGLFGGRFVQCGGVNNSAYRPVPSRPPSVWGNPQEIPVAPNAINQIADPFIDPSGEAAVAADAYNQAFIRSGVAGMRGRSPSFRPIDAPKEDSVAKVGKWASGVKDASVQKLTEAKVWADRQRQQFASMSQEDWERFLEGSAEDIKKGIAYIRHCPEAKSLEAFVAASGKLGEKFAKERNPDAMRVFEELKAKIPEDVSLLPTQLTLKQMRELAQSAAKFLNDYQAEPEEPLPPDKEP